MDHEYFATYLWLLFGVWSGYVLNLGYCSNINPCVLKCKDTHMNLMRSVLGEEISEWSVEFLMPIQTILKHSPSSASAENKFNRACQYNSDYDHCLNRCPESMAKIFLSMGHEPWRFICSYHSRTVLSTITECWKEHIVEIQTACALRNVGQAMDGLSKGALNGDTIGPLCTSIKHYDDCHLWTLSARCGSGAGNFLISLNKITNKTLFKLLKHVEARKNLPPACEQWTIAENVTFNDSRPTQSPLTSCSTKSLISLLICLIYIVTNLAHY